MTSTWWDVEQHKFAEKTLKIKYASIEFNYSRPNQLCDPKKERSRNDVC